MATTVRFPVGKKYRNPSDTKSGAYNKNEKRLNPRATRLAKKTMMRIPSITTMLTNQVVPKYKEMVVMLLVSSNRNPAPKQKKWTSTAGPAFPELNHRKRNAVASSAPILNK